MDQSKKKEPGVKLTLKDPLWENRRDRSRQGAGVREGRGVKGIPWVSEALVNIHDERCRPEKGVDVINQSTHVLDSVTKKRTTTRGLEPCNIYELFINNLIFILLW